MKRVWVTALLAGFALAALVSGFPAALAADHVVTASSGPAWSPDMVTIAVNDSVTWSNPTTLDHNVCVSKPGSPQGTCDEYGPAPGLPTHPWATTVSHTFAVAGTYQYRCQLHTSMTGTVQVGPPGTTTTTTTPPPTGTGTTPTSTTPAPTTTQTSTTPTQTTTVPTQTTGTSADTKAPLFTGAIRKLAGRKSLKLELTTSEDATLTATVFRKPPRGRSFARVGRASLNVHTGRNRVTLPPKATAGLRNGAYRISLVLADAAGNRSPARMFTYKLA
jgi:plastocyanin